VIFFGRKLSRRDPAREKILRKFEKHIGYRFKNLNLLNTALTHPSYLNEKLIKDQPHYERMEFLGDSVLGLVVCGHIYNKFPDYDEGDLSGIKSHVVSEKSLYKIAKRMELGKYILFGSGEARTGGRRKSSILANVFESVTGSIFLDGGFKKCQQFILKFAEDDIIIHPPDREASNHKGKLQKLGQHYFAQDPHYIIASEEGPSHARSFVVEVCVDGNKLGEGKGRSKKEAEQKAARNSLRYIATKEFKDKFGEPEIKTKSSKKRKSSRWHKKATPDISKNLEN